MLGHLSELLRGLGGKKVLSGLLDIDSLGLRLLFSGFIFELEVRAYILSGLEPSWHLPPR